MTDITNSYRYKLNEYSHMLLEKAFFKLSPIMRRSGKWDDSGEILKSELYNTEAFTSLTTDELIKSLDISDVLLQDICEYLELHQHIRVTHSLNNNIIKEIRPTKLGFKAFKFETYLEKNETLIYQDKFKESILKTNQSITELNSMTIPKQFETNKRLTAISIIVSSTAVFIACASFISSLLLRDTQTPTILSRQLRITNSLRQSLDSINASIKNLKSTSYIDISKTKAK